MTKQQAHKSVTEKYHASLISQADASHHHQQIDQIGTGNRYGHKISPTQKAKLYAVWA